MARKQIKQVCRECDATVDLKPIYDYPWDGSDTEGSISELVGYRCNDRVACRMRHVHVNMPDDTYSRGTGQGWGHQQ